MKRAPGGGGGWGDADNRRPIMRQRALRCEGRDAAVRSVHALNRKERCMKRSASILMAAVAAGGSLWLGGCAWNGSGEGGGEKASAAAATSEVRSESMRAYNDLLAKQPAAKALAGSAEGVLVFPKVYKAGLLVGGYHGEGSMIRNGRAEGRYGTSGASYGLQAGVQKYAYALFFMTDADLQYLEQSSGWEVGVGPSVTVVDAGLASSLTTTTGRSGVYCFFFDQKGLMAGLGIQGSKITRLDK